MAFRSLTEQMDTTKPHGELLFSLFGALAQYERALTRERVMAGLAAAKRRGRQGGRPPTIDAEMMEQIKIALDGGASKASVCRSFKVARSTLIGSLERVGWSAPAKPQRDKHFLLSFLSPMFQESSMPIRPEQRWFYPIDWRQLSAIIRFTRAKERCERCGRPHGRDVVHLGDGRWFDEERQQWRNDAGRRARGLPSAHTSKPHQLCFEDLMVLAVPPRSTRVVLASASMRSINAYFSRGAAFFGHISFFLCCSGNGV